ANAASPYATRTGQKRSSANADLLPLVRAAPLDRELGDLAELALEPDQLERDDEHVGEDEREDDEVRGGGVLLRRAHASSSRSSRRRASRRLPTSSIR